MGLPAPSLDLPYGFTDVGNLDEDTLFHVDDLVRRDGMIEDRPEGLVFHYQHSSCFSMNKRYTRREVFLATIFTEINCGWKRDGTESSSAPSLFERHSLSADKAVTGQTVVCTSYDSVPFLMVHV